MSVPINRLTDISIFCLVCIGNYPGSCDRRRGGVAKRVIAKAIPEPVMVDSCKLARAVPGSLPAPNYLHLWNI